VQQVPPFSAWRDRLTAGAREKARFGIDRLSGKFVVGADQTLALGDRLFSKPAGRRSAEQLRALPSQP